MQRARTETRRKLVVSAAARRLQQIDEEIETIFRAFPTLRTSNHAEHDVFSVQQARPTKHRKDAKRSRHLR